MQSAESASSLETSDNDQSAEASEEQAPLSRLARFRQHRRYRLVFWLMIVVLGLLGYLSWQFANKTAETSAKGVVSHFLSYPLASYRVLSPLRYVTREEVESVLLSYQGQSYWDLPLPEIQSRLLRLDWVSDVTVSRNWPDKLDILIAEQRPLARWGDNGLITQAGEVFYPRSITSFSDWVQLNGALDKALLVVRRYNSFLRELKPLGFIIQSADLSADDVWTLKLYQGPEVVFTEKDWRLQLSRFVAAYSQLDEQVINSAQGYDLRYSNGFSIIPKVPEIGAKNKNNQD